MTFKTYADEWLQLKRQDVGDSQYIVYSCMLKHLQPIYEKEVGEIRVNDIQAIITALSAYNPYTKRPTARKTLNDVKMTAKQVLQYAIDQRDISWNAAEAVKIPKNAPQHARRALTEKEREIIISTPNPLRTAAMIAMFAGLRRGELIPLEWSDIDLTVGTIWVHKAVDLSHNKPIVKGTKTDAGTRFVQIPKILQDYLIEERTRQIEFYSPETPCIVISDELMSASQWRGKWDQYVHDLGIPDVTIHMLRHTACTMMVESGMDLSSVQQQMGHADIQTTMNTYTHVTQKHIKTEIDKLNTYLTVSNEKKSEKMFDKQPTFPFFPL